MFDNENNELSITPVWEITCDFRQALIITERDNMIIISIDDDAYVDEELRLTASAPDGSLSSSMIIRIESLL